MKDLDYLRGKSPHSVAIVGATGAGKTAFAYKLLEVLREDGRPVFVLQHPKPELLEPIEFKMLPSLEELTHMTDAIIWIDEPQIHIPVADHRANTILQRVLSLARQRNITIILSTSETRFITRSVEAYIDVWIVKDIEASLVKQGSIIKNLIKRHVIVSITEFCLAKEEYLFESRKFREFNGKHTCGLPGFWSEEYSKPYGEAIHESLREESRKNSENSARTITIEKFRELCRVYIQQQELAGVLVRKKCSHCGFEKEKHDLAWHHEQYTYPFTVDDVVCVCRSCHRNAHTEQDMTPEVVLATWPSIKKEVTR